MVAVKRFPHILAMDGQRSGEYITHFSVSWLFISELDGERTAPYFVFHSSGQFEETSDGIALPLSGQPF